MHLITTTTIVIAATVEVKADQEQLRIASEWPVDTCASDAPVSISHATCQGFFQTLSAEA